MRPKNIPFRVDRQLGAAFTIIDQADQIVGTAVIGDDMLADRGPSLSEALEHARLFAAAPQLLDELMAACRERLSHNGRPMAFDTWALPLSSGEASAMKQRLILIAKLRGKSTFGNDWMDALE